MPKKDIWWIWVCKMSTLNIAKGPWNFSWLNSIPRRWRTNKRVSNSWLLQSSWLPGCKTYVVKFLKPSTLCAPCHRDKHFAKRHAAFTPHSRIIHSRPHYGGTHLILEKKKTNLFSFLLAVLNVRFCPIMGSKVLKWITASRKIGVRNQILTVFPFSLYVNFR